MTDSTRTQKIAGGFIRLALAAAFLSAVADRIGLWGSPGAAGVSWGDWGSFLDYVALLNPLAPASLIPLLGGIATVAKVVLAIGLLVGWKLRWFAIGSGLLLVAFAFAMITTTGIKSALDYSVLSAASAAFILATFSKK